LNRPNEASVKKFISVRESELFISTVVSLLFLAFISFVGTSDIEESTKISYSAGVDVAQADSSDVAGIHSILGVPIFDTLQGTGDRLPYQSSWSQSVTWPLRVIGSLELYVFFRTLLYSSAALALSLMTVRSWMPSLASRWLYVTAALMNSSFGLYVRQNEWSDTYVQTIGIVGGAMFLLKRDFFVESQLHKNCSSPLILVLIYLSVNGVVTGHPGYFPLAAAIWMSFFLSLISLGQYREIFLAWVRREYLGVAAVLVSAAVSLTTTVYDLSLERQGLDWSASRRKSVQGFNGTEAFKGLSRGLLPESVEELLSVAASTVWTPILRVLYPLVDQWDFSRRLAVMFPRGEFSALLILFVVPRSLKHLRNSELRKLLGRFAVAQATVLALAVFSHVQALPVALLTSGAWQYFPILLALNVAVGFILLRHINRREVISRIVCYISLFSAGIWMVMQLGFGLVGARLELPDKAEHWTRETKSISSSVMYQEKLSMRYRIAMIDSREIGDDKQPRWQNFLKFTSLGIPVVAPADPKVRGNPQLVGTFGAYNTSIGFISPTGLRATKSDQFQKNAQNRPPNPNLTQVFDFLQVKYLLVDATPKNDMLRRVLTQEGWREWGSGDKNRSVQIDKADMRLFEREGYSAHWVETEKAGTFSLCPILQQECPVISNAVRTKWSPNPWLSLCEMRDCLWKIRIPRIPPDQLLVLPIAYDPIFSVKSRNGVDLMPANAGGFLAVGSTEGAEGSDVLVMLRPDFRIACRVLSSYVNLAAFLFLITILVSSLLTARRRRLRIK